MYFNRVNKGGGEGGEGRECMQAGRHIYINRNEIKIIIK